MNCTLEIAGAFNIRLLSISTTGKSRFSGCKICYTTYGPQTRSNSHSENFQFTICILTKIPSYHAFITFQESPVTFETYPSIFFVKDHQMTLLVSRAENHWCQRSTTILGAHAEWIFPVIFFWFPWKEGCVGTGLFLGLPYPWTLLWNRPQLGFQFHSVSKAESWYLFIMS